jgi:uroporphyrinogen decarboxylase
MRQAGRSLPEYRQARADIPMVQACRIPELVCEITMQPVRRLGVDAAVFFSDIVVPLAAAGIDVEIKPGVGPVVAHPVRTSADVDALPELAPEQIEDIAQSVRLLIAELGGTPLIGFAGAPFTLASYLVEGGPSKNHEHTKALMYGAPDVWNALCAKLSRISGTFLRVQAEAGASAIQLFDSWVGALSLRDYQRFVQRHSAAALAAVADLDVPRIHFGVGTGELLVAMGEAGADVVGVDYRVPLDEAARRVGPSYSLQGNLDPALLFAPWEPLEAKVREILDQGKAARGHIFNLGHGVLPSTDPEMLKRVVQLVHSVSA